MSRVKTALSLCLPALVLNLFLLTGCGSNNPAAPLSQFQPEIVNLTDSFSFQATAVQNVTTTLTYSWQNTGTLANIDHSSAVDSGLASITIFDSNDSLVYSSGLVASLNENSSTGVAGTWRIVVQLTNVYGTLNFRVQKQ
ncbi:MAG: hypothetical protein D6800_10835 [Candidatus Zixiibacteriota bacterium]|nr:MAG: hypothetical protein D6800_10835 [candidate division Zixibacteria bacterium]